MQENKKKYKKTEKIDYKKINLKINIQINI
jgi:hypothetical protein